MSGPNPVLVYLPTGEVVSSTSSLQGSLKNSGWEMGNGGEPDRVLYIKPPSGPSDLFEERISIPLAFSKLTSVDMYDIVLKNPNSFTVRFN
ncbi:unnamed protein product [Eruca vesicaria subsp. sativa]|uniref:Uncharacterized protein n=1 Tax=Eruca vesicaria subsp. sativa TaxID=29727 RepID=A0ABC8KDE8_ERUVS|nr:unnamed protein product [Eruca vesicaria subsp. sativa]